MLSKTNLCRMDIDTKYCHHITADKDIVGLSKLRLVNGNATSGRLEVYHNGEWGTVCDDDFSDSDAQAFCNTLGFG